MKQSPNDHKQYKSLTLTNGLKVLLIHNSESSKSAAALAVNVGHFSDPQERQGLAHFLEHMLFLGTEKYPDGSEYQKFINQYGGSNNAWTATEHTCFFFDINHLHFEAALDRFSQFFTAPLLSQEFVEKERKNIDSEFKLKLKDDIRRLYDVHKETVNPAHPFAKFSVGSSETLADKPNSLLHQEVRDFYHQHYFAKAMTLALEGPQSIEELTQLAEEKFSQIAEGSGLPPELTVPLYNSEHLQIKINIKPVKNDKQLILSFALPNINEFYRNKPEATLVYLLGHEGSGSILSALKKNNFALGLTAGSGINGSNFKDFNISIRLTEHGEQHIDEIITIVFQYIELIRQSDLPDFYYQEKKSLAELSFHYQEKTKPLESVCQLVISMHHYPMEDCIYGDYVMDGFDRVQCLKLLELFTPENMRVIHISQQGEFDRISHWYQVPYKLEPLSKSTITKWINTEPSAQLSLPPKNDYIVNNPTVLPDEDINQQLPKLITQQDGLKVWFKQDVSFKVPKGYIYINIDSPKLIESNENIAMTRLFVEVFGESVIEEHYDAELAGIHYHVYAHQGGLTLQLSGISQKQPKLLKNLLSYLLSFTPLAHKFELFKYQLINQWHNADSSKSISQLFAILSSFMQPKNPSSKKLATALNGISYQDFKLFCQNIFEQLTLEVFIHGNWHESDANEIKNIVVDSFKQQYSDKYQVNIPLLDIEGQHHIELPLVLPEHDHACVVFYPMADRSLSITAKAMLASQLLSPAFFQQMRTEKQYGYLVGVSFVPINRYPGLAFYIQSPKVDAHELKEAMEDFIENCHGIMSEITEEHWQHLTYGLASQLREKDTSLRIKSQRFWASICNKDDNFSQKQQLIEEILKLERNDMLSFIKNQLSPSKCNIDRISLVSLKEQKSDLNIDLDQLIKKITENCSNKY